MWFTLKDVGEVQVFSAQPPFEYKATLHMGPITNHLNFANDRNGKFAYVTIGGANAVKVFRRGATPQLVATIPTDDLPHGIWRLLQSGFNLQFLDWASAARDLVGRYRARRIK